MESTRKSEDSSLVNEKNLVDEKIAKYSDPDYEFRLKAGTFMLLGSTVSLLSGFGTALAFTRRKDPKHFDKSFALVREAALYHSGSRLAVKALAYGSLLAIGGVSTIVYGIWKLSGAKNFEEFRFTAGSVLPEIPKSPNPRGRTEFENLTDLMQYVIDLDAEEKRLKKIQEQSKDPTQQ